MRGCVHACLCFRVLGGSYLFLLSGSVGESYLTMKIGAGTSELMRFAFTAENVQGCACSRLFFLLPSGHPVFWHT